MLLALLLALASSPAPVALEVDVAGALRPALLDEAARFTRETGVPVHLRDGRSIDLVKDLDADVLISANEGVLAEGDRQHLFNGHPQPITTTQLVLATLPGQLEKVHGLADLARDDVRLLMAPANVTVGRLTREVLARTVKGRRILARPAVEVPNGLGLCAALKAGRGDAGLVYASDAFASGGIYLIELPEVLRVKAVFRGAVLRRSKLAAAGAAFLAQLRTVEAQGRLFDQGFLAPF